jgi:DNA-binding transcriptional LysR family regulator
MVERGRADIGVIPYFPESPRSSQLLYEHLFDLQFMVLAAPSHPLARKKQIAPRDLARVPLILDGDPSSLSSLENANQVTLERVFRLHDLQEPKNVVMDCPLVELAQKYVALNLGVAALYLDPDAGRGMPGVRVRPLEPRPPDLGVAMIVRKGAHLPRCVLEFQEIARSTLSRKAGRRKG